MIKRGRKYCVGSLHNSRNFGTVEVVEYIDTNNILVKFLNTGSLLRTKSSQLGCGTIKDRFAKTIYGMGFIGFGKTWECGEHTLYYRYWLNMFHRCYRKDHPNCRTYESCSVGEGFHSFENFEEWCDRQVGFGNKGWHLDKDILLKGNKVYSPEACCFVPQEINVLFTKREVARGDYPIGVSRKNKGGGYQVQLSQFRDKYLGTYATPEEAFLAYKQAKETYIKEVANKWKDQIDPRVYNALMKYEVEITD